MTTLTAQFGHPVGVIGWLAGQMMAFEHRELVAWATDLLDLRPVDHVLEIGFGPGTAIERIAQAAPLGFVAGVDLSEIMVGQAAARNAAAIREGRVDLRQGSAAALPFDDERFDRALVINSLDHWSSPARGLQEMHRVLKPNGMACIVARPHEARTEDAVRQAGEQAVGLLRAAGFRRAWMIPGLNATAVGVLATR